MLQINVDKDSLQLANALLPQLLNNIEWRIDEPPDKFLGAWLLVLVEYGQPSKANPVRRYTLELGQWNGSWYWQDVEDDAEPSVCGPLRGVRAWAHLA